MKPNAFMDPNNLTYTSAVDFLSSEMPFNRPFLPWKAHLEMLRVKEPLNKHAKTDTVKTRIQEHPFSGFRLIGIGYFR